MRKVLWLFLVLLGFKPCADSFPPEVLERMKSPPPPHIQKRFGGWEEFGRKAEQLGPLVSILDTALGLYWLDQGRFPRSWQEVCQQDWLPLRCDLLRNPFTGRSILKQERRELGAMWPAVREGKLYLVLYFYSLPELGPPRELWAPREPMYRNLFIQKSWPKLDLPVKRAFAARELAASVLRGEAECAKALGWQGLGKRFPVVRAIRNPYAGEAVKATLWNNGYLFRSELRERAKGALAGALLVAWFRVGERWDLSVDLVLENGRLLEDALREAKQTR